VGKESIIVEKKGSTSLVRENYCYDYVPGRHRKKQKPRHRMRWSVKKGAPAPRAPAWHSAWGTRVLQKNSGKVQIYRVVPHRKRGDQRARRRKSHVVMAKDRKIDKANGEGGATKKKDETRKKKKKQWTST